MNGGTICWRSKIQPVMALSMIEVEYIAVTHTCKKVTWLKKLLGEVKVKHNIVRVNCNSQSVLHFIKNQVFHSRMNYIEMRYLYMEDVSFR